MAFISLTSTNPKFSWILDKNPETQRANDAPFEKKGKTYSNFLLFEDDNTASLYAKILNANGKKSKSSQLDFTQHTAGSVYLQLIDSMLRSALTKSKDFDNQEATLTFTVYNHSMLDYKERLPDVVTECITKNKHSKIKIVAPSVKKALEVCAVISILTSFYDEEYYIEDSQYLKYFAYAVELTKEYSLLRQFVSFIKSDSLYKSALPMIETTPFLIGKERAFDARRNFYRNELGAKTKSKELLELGCGEGAYMKSHLKFYNKVNSIEPDEAVHHEAYHAIRKISAEDTITLHHTDAMSYLLTLNNLNNVDVLLTEVLEHIDYEESMSIIDKIVSMSPDKFLLTLPNHDFNIFYGYKEGEFRHDDHLWEPTVSKFEEIYFELTEKYGTSYTITDHYLGDHVKASPKNCASFALLFTKK